MQRRPAALSGDGRWLCLPSESGDEAHARVWSVDAVLAFARECGTPAEALAEDDG